MDMINVSSSARRRSPCVVLGVKPQTLYANVSRGRIAARPDPADPRRSLYNRDDVDRLSRRSRRSAARAATVAAEAMRLGRARAGVRDLNRRRRAVDLSRAGRCRSLADGDTRGRRGVAVGRVPGRAPHSAEMPPQASRSPFRCCAAGGPLAAIRAHRSRDDAAARSSVLADSPSALGPGEGPIHLRLAALRTPRRRRQSARAPSSCSPITSSTPRPSRPASPSRPAPRWRPAPWPASPR